MSITLVVYDEVPLYIINADWSYYKYWLGELREKLMMEENMDLLVECGYE